jgi:hypothetical protein
MCGRRLNILAKHGKMRKYPYFHTDCGILGKERRILKVRNFQGEEVAK